MDISYITQNQWHEIFPIFMFAILWIGLVGLIKSRITRGHKGGW